MTKSKQKAGIKRRGAKDAKTQGRDGRAGSMNMVRQEQLQGPSPMDGQRNIQRPTSNVQRPTLKADGRAGTIKVWSLGGDGPKCGTFGGAFATEAEAYKSLLEEIGFEDDDAANALLAAGSLDALEDLLQYSMDGLTTWTIDEQEISFSLVDALNGIAACGMLSVFDVDSKRLFQITPDDEWWPASINGGAVQINLQRASSGL